MVKTFHPWCRTVTVPYFEDNYTERFARGADGKVDYVDGDMKYEDWFRSLSKDKQDRMRFDRKKAKNYIQDKAQYEKYKTVLGKEMPSSFDKFQELKYNNGKEWEEIKAKKQEVLNSLDYRDSFFGKFGDKEVREWYIAHDKNIISLVDKTKSLKEQAIQAYSLRNKYRTEARLMMKNRELALELDMNKPNLPIEYYIDKYAKKGYDGDVLYEKILESSTRSNKAVNKRLGLEE